METIANPTATLYVATNEDGEAQVWLTEDLFYAKTSSPPVISNIDFSPYELKVVSRDTSETQNITLTGHNSTIPLDFKLEFPGGELPECTLQQTLDINNDGEVNIRDATVILRYIAGKNVEPGEPKGLSLIHI